MMQNIIAARVFDNSAKRELKMYAELKRKKCSKCEKTKEAKSFYFKAKNSGLRPECKKCTDAINAKYAKTPRGKKAAKKAKTKLLKDPKKLAKYKKQQAFSARRKKYGVDETLFNKMWSEQFGVCAICPSKLTKASHVDHCHKTGQVRGLLCFRCNSGLGFFQDNIGNLTGALSYLMKFKK